MIGKTFRLTGRDFQSWKSFDLPVSGFTVIVGASDRGKSALIRALQGVLRNEVTSNQVSWWAKDSSVTLTPEGESCVTLTRTPKTTSYTVGDEEFSKLAGGVPPAVADFKCGSVDTGGVKLDPIFAGQFDQQFMLTLSPSELNTVFGLFSSTEKLSAGKKLAASKNAELGSTAKFLASEIQEAEVKKSQLTTLVAEFEVASTKLERLASLAEQLSHNLATLQSLQGVIASVRSLRAADFPLPSAEELALVLNQNRLLSRYRKTRAASNELSGCRESLPIDPDLRRQGVVATQLAKWRSLKVRSEQFQVVRVADARLGELANDLGSMARASTQLTHLRSYLDRADLAEIRSSLSSLETQYQQESSRVLALQGSGVQCPKCGHLFKGAE